MGCARWGVQGGMCKAGCARWRELGGVCKAVCVGQSGEGSGQGLRVGVGAVVSAE